MIIITEQSKFDPDFVEKLPNLKKPSFARHSDENQRKLSEPSA